MTQLSLILMLGFALLFGDWARAKIARLSPEQRRNWTRGTAGLILLLPLPTLGFLRFDLVPPQPELSAIIAQAKPDIRADLPLAVLVPGDLDDIGGSYVRGQLMYAAPRLIPPRIDTETTADAPTLARLAASGYHQALLGCSAWLPASIAAPPRSLVLLNYTDNHWQVAASWQYSPDFGRPHWSSLMPKPSFCGNS